MRETTICFLLKGKRICLAMKKRGFGEGKWNGVGGKVGDKEEHKNETVEESAVREIKEELEVVAKDLEKVADIFFKFPHKPEWNQHCHVFFLTSSF